MEEQIMYSALKNLGIKTFIIREAPFAVTAGILAEIFFKFGSFTFELLAFLSIWTILSWAAQNLLKMSKK